MGDLLDMKEFGLEDMDLNDEDGLGDFNDEDLEAELEAELTGKPIEKKSKAVKKSAGNSKPALDQKVDLESLLKDPIPNEGDNMDEEALMAEMAKIASSEGIDMNFDEDDKNEDISTKDEHKVAVAPIPAAKPAIDVTAKQEQLKASIAAHTKRAIELRNSGRRGEAMVILEKIKAAKAELAKISPIEDTAPLKQKKEVQIEKKAATNTTKTAKKLNIDPNDLKRMISASVLEWEVKRLESEMANLRKSKQEIPVEMETRKMAAESKVAILEEAVGNGKLSPEDYLKQILFGFNTEVKVLDHLQGIGDQKNAAIVYKRLSLMRDEVIELAEDTGIQVKAPSMPDAPSKSPAKAVPAIKVVSPLDGPPQESSATPNTPKQFAKGLAMELEKDSKLPNVPTKPAKKDKKAQRSAVKATSPPSPTSKNDPTVSKADLEERNKKFNFIEEELRKQLKTIRFCAKHCLSLKMNQRAVLFHRDGRMIENDLDLLKSMKSSKIAPPNYNFEEKEIFASYDHPEIDENALVMEIVRFSNLKPGSGKKSISPYLSVVFPYPSSENQKTKTDVIDGPTADVGHSHTFEVSRKSHSFVERLAKKRVKVKVKEKRFLRKPTVVGNFRFTLEKLEECAESTDEFKVLAGESRSDSGGTVEIKMKIRRPFKAQKDVRMEVKKFLVVTKSEEEASAEKIAREQVPKLLNPTAAGRGRALSDALEKPARSPQRAKSVTQRPKEDLKPIDYDPLALGMMISNDVLEWEVKRVSKEIKRRRAAKEDATDLETRKMQAEAKISILEQQVESGKITPEYYSKKLTERIGGDKSLCSLLLQHSRRDEAKYVLKRVQIMQAELAEMNEDM